MTRWRRIWRHFNTGTSAVRRCFPADSMITIERAIRACETRHAGEIRFAVEDSLPFALLWRRLTPRERAIQKFAELKVWDTVHNNGVLIYLLLADRDVEIVADRGVAKGVVPQAEWETCCRIMESRFREGHFEDGVVAGIEAVAAVLARHPPGPPRTDNELPDTPTVL